MGREPGPRVVRPAAVVPLNRPIQTRDFTVSELGAELDAVVAEAFGPVWVVGAIERLRRHSNGHTYFELVEKARGDSVVGRLDAVIWRGDRWRIDGILRRAGAELVDGAEARCLVELGFWAPGGRLQASVRALDPVFTLGAIERRRRQIRERLAAAGIATANRELELSVLPLTIGLVASGDSAAFHDVLASLRASGRPFRVTHFDVRVQGAAAEREIAGAIGVLGRAALDCVVLVRGGGARGDLAVFDSLAVAEAVARCPLPVLTGLGHETDTTLADEVAWRACHTPTRVAELLASRVETAGERLATLGSRLASTAQRLVERGRLRLGRARLRLVPCGRRLDRSRAAFARRLERLAAAGARRIDFGGTRLAERESRLGSAAGRRIAAATPLLELSRERIARLPQVRLERAAQQLETAARWSRELGPQRWLARGFSLTRDENGKILRRANGVDPGARIHTELGEGSIVSRVEEVS